MSRTTRIALLGPLEVTVDGAVATITSRTQRTVLLRLATDAIAEAVWGENLPENPPNAVRYHIWKLREAVGPGVVETIPSGYRLAAEAIEVDAKVFSDLVGSVAGLEPSLVLERLDRALSLWRGDAYADVRDAEFAQPDIRRLEELRRGALRLRARALVDGGRIGEGIAEAERLIERDPYDEGLWSTLMTGLYRDGRQAEALRVYQRARSVLGNDLGIEPTPELTALEQQVLVHDDGLREERPVPTNLAAPITSFLGRAAEMDEVGDLLGERRLVTIVGAGGTGKTRLATEIGRRSIDDFEGGVWFVDLTSLRGGDDVFAAIGAAVGLSLSDPDASPRREVLAFLRRPSYLLLLDNAEHMLDDVSDAAIDLLERTTSGRVLVTSRAPLRVPGEVVFPIPRLSVPEPPWTWDSVESTGAGHLFTARAADAGLVVQTSAIEAELVGRICIAVEGLPLAIELSAARARTTPLADLADEVENRLAIGVQRGTSDRHRTMEAMIAWSYELLDDTARSVFRRVGVFIGGFSLDAAVQSCARVGLDEEAVRSALLTLTDQSMVERDDREHSRYRLLEPFRHFALDRLRDHGELEAALGAHAEAFHDIVVASLPVQRGPDRNRVRRGLRTEAANIRAALERFEEAEEGERLCRMVAALSRFWIDQRQRDDISRWSSACAPFIDAQAIPTRTYLHCLTAHALAYQGATSEASDHMARAIELARSSGGGLLLADVTTSFLSQTDAFAFGELLGPRDDVALARRAVQIYREHGDRWGEVQALIDTANALLWERPDSPEEVLPVAREARRIAMDNDNPEGAVWALMNEISALTVVGKSSASESIDQDVASLAALMLDLAGRAETPDPLSEALVQQGGILYDHGDVAEAIAAVRQSADLADRRGTMYVSITAHTSLAIYLEDVDEVGALEEIVTGLRRSLDRAIDRQTVWVVEIAARFLEARDHGDLAARLIGAAEHQRLDGRNTMPAWDVARYSETVERIRDATGARFDSLREEGSAWSIQQAAKEALAALEL